MERCAAGVHVCAAGQHVCAGGQHLQLLPPQVDASGFTPLHVAALEGELEYLAALLLAGADVEAQVGPAGGAEAGHRAIHLAAAYGHAGCVRTLILGGASREALTCGIRGGLTAAHCAAANGHVDALLAAGADLDAIDDTRWPCLHLLARHAARKHGSVTPAQLQAVIEAGASIESACVAGCCTPLHELLKHSAPAAYIAELAQ